MRVAILWLIHVMVLAAGLLLAYRPTIESSFTRLQTDHGDTVLNHFILEHGWRALAKPGYPFSLLSPGVFHPESLVLGYSEPLLGMAPVYWFWRLLLEPVPAFALWMISCSALNYLAFAAVARWLKWDAGCAILGSFLWAFAALVLHHEGHQQLIARMWMPVAAYHAYRFALEPNTRSLGWGLAVLAMQAAACANLGVLLGYGLLMFTCVALSLRQHGWRRLRRNIARRPRAFFAVTAAGLGLCLVALLPVVLANVRTGTVRGYETTLAFMPGPASWLAPPPGWRWNESLGSLRNAEHSECCLFGGAGMLILWLLALVPWLAGFQRRRSRVWLAASCGLAAAALAILVTNFGGGASPWWLARLLPGGMSVRAVGRMAIVCHLFVILGGLTGLQLLLSRWRMSWKWKRLAFVGIAGLIAFEQTGYSPPSVDAAEFYSQVPPLAAAMAGADAAYVAPSDHRTWLAQQVLAMWAGLEAGVPVINGYSGRYPHDYPVVWFMSDDELKRWLAGRQTGVLAIVEPDAGIVRRLHLP